MRIRDIAIEAVAAGTNWKVVSLNEIDEHDEIVEWRIEEAKTLTAGDYVVYSGLSEFDDGEVRPILLVREVGTLNWWGDSCEYVDGRWKDIGYTGKERRSEEFIANPLPDDESFTGEYRHQIQRDGFAKWKNKLVQIRGGLS